jgi:hypothetical protein
MQSTAAAATSNLLSSGQLLPVPRSSINISNDAVASMQVFSGGPVWLQSSSKLI